MPGCCQWVSAYHAVSCNNGIAPSFAVGEEVDMPQKAVTGILFSEGRAVKMLSVLALFTTTCDMMLSNVSSSGDVG